MVDAGGKSFLSYPYADDGMRIWQSLEKYFAAYLDIYYGTGEGGDKRVLADFELQAWWQDVTVSTRHPYAWWDLSALF